MGIATTGAIFPNGNWIPEHWATKALAKYYSAFVVPHISNHDYIGEITKVGDKVNIPVRPDITIFDGVDYEDLNTQSALADENETLEIDTFKYFNVPMSDIARFQSSVDQQNLIGDQAAINMGTAVERDVLRSIYSDAYSTVSATSWTSANALGYILDAELALNELDVPDDGGRFLILPARAVKQLELSDLKAAYLTGEGSTPLRRGSAQILDRPLGSFNRVFMTNNLSWTTTTAHAIAGHMDALCFASQINDTEIIRSERFFGHLLRGKIVYGYKVVQPKALVHINIAAYS